MAQVDFSRSRIMYREMYGHDMPQDFELYITKACQWLNTTPEDVDFKVFQLAIWIKMSVDQVPSQIAEVLDKNTAALITKINRAGYEQARAAIEAETKRSIQDQRAMFEAVIQNTAQEAQRFAPTAYKFRATAGIAALVLSVMWFAYGYGVFQSSKRFYVTDLIENNKGIKTFKIQDVKVAGMEVSQAVFDGKSVLFVPASDKINDASKGWVKDRLNLKNPVWTACLGALIGAIATLLIVYFHNIALAIERGVSWVKSLFKKEESN